MGFLTGELSNNVFHKLVSNLSLDYATLWMRTWTACERNGRTRGYFKKFLASSGNKRRNSCFGAKLCTLKPYISQTTNTQKFEEIKKAWQESLELSCCCSVLTAQMAEAANCNFELLLFNRHGTIWLLEVRQLKTFLSLQRDDKKPLSFCGHQCQAL